MARLEPACRAWLAAQGWDANDLEQGGRSLAAFMSGEIVKETAPLKKMLAEVEWVDGDDLSLPSCRFCNAVGPNGTPTYVKYQPADPHDADCQLALALGLPMREKEES